MTYITQSPRKSLQRRPQSSQNKAHLSTNEVMKPMLIAILLLWSLLMFFLPSRFISLVCNHKLHCDLSLFWCTGMFDCFLAMWATNRMCSISGRFHYDSLVLQHGNKLLQATTVIVGFYSIMCLFLWYDRLLHDCFFNDKDIIRKHWTIRQSHKTPFGPAPYKLPSYAYFYSDLFKKIQIYSKRTSRIHYNVTHAMQIIINRQWDKHQPSDPSTNPSLYKNDKWQIVCKGMH